MRFKEITDVDIDLNDLIKVSDDKYLIVRKAKGDRCDNCIFTCGRHKKFDIPNLCDMHTIYCQLNRRHLHPNTEYFLIFDIFNGI